MVKAVIFDMDGVLIDTEKWLNKYWRQAAAEAGYDMTVEDGLAIRSLAAKYAAPFLQERFGADFPYWTIRERRKELMKAHIAANLSVGATKQNLTDALRVADPLLGFPRTLNALGLVRAAK